MTTSIRAKVDRELTSRVGKWFTVRQIQDKLSINPSTLKPLIMKYAREKVLLRRKVKGTARSVEFSPAAKNVNSFQQVLTKYMPYRNVTGCPTGKMSKSCSTGSWSKKSKASKTSHKTSSHKTAGSKSRSSR